MPTFLRAPFVAALALAACTPIETDAPLPDAGFDFSTGSAHEQGDVWLRTVEYLHATNGTTVVLVPMIHVAEAQYFRAVQAEMDAADVVLLEGVGGDASLGPNKLLTTYVFACYPRMAALGGFALQSEVLVAGANAENADLAMDEFKAQMPWHTPLVQLALFPLVVAGFETLNAVAFACETLSWPVLAHDAYEAGFRHVFTSGLVARADREADEDDENHDLLLPGVLDARNERLLAVLDATMATRAGGRVVVPWGAAHMPGVEAGLHARGFAPSDARWRLAMKIKRLHDGVTPRDDDVPFDLYVPFALQVRALAPAWSVSMLFHSIAWEHGPAHDDAFSLLWDLAFQWRQQARGDATSWQVLPSLFGRPLLLAYDRRSASKRVRFLGFGEVRWGA